MIWENATKKNDNNYEIPSDWLFIHYYEALNILFRFENSLRVFVYIMLKKKYKNKWNEISISIDDQKTSISAIAKKRGNQAKVFGYLGYEISNSLMHLTSGELIEIILSDSYWELFKPYFRGSKEIMRTKLLEIGTVRNSLAHFRPIKQDDVDVIKQNIKQTFIGIEESFIEIFNSNNYVPTNCNENWYKKLSVIGSDYLKFIFRQSKDEKWVELICKYSVPIIKKESWSEDYYSFYLANLITPQLLEKYDNLKDNLIFVEESSSSPYTEKAENIEFIKYISFLFHRETLSENYEEVYTDLTDMISKVSEEIELLENDNLAKGELLEPIRTSVLPDDNSKYLETNPKILLIKNKANFPEEYWGGIDKNNHSFITSSNQYPWMITSISDDDDLPF